MSKLLAFRPLLGLILAALLFSGCQFVPPRPPAAPVMADAQGGQPFTSRFAGDDGVISLWSGDNSGHEPGGTSVFDLALENGGQQAWQGRYCVYLLSQDWRMEALAQEDFALDPGASRSRPLQGHLPTDLEPGRYGLVLVLQRPAGPTVELHYIQVGPPEAQRPPQTASIPTELVEIARARCTPAPQAYPSGQAPVGMAAEDTVRLFYWDYLQAARPDAEGARRNPAAEGAYRDSPYLAPGFARQVEEMVQSGLPADPFLCAQDVPLAFQIAGSTIGVDAVFVDVHTGLGNQFQVVVVDQGDAWRIANVLCSAGSQPATTRAADPDATAYRQEEITFTNSEISLAGTLTWPAGDGPHPAAILLTGSGPQNRDNGAAELPAYRPFRQIATHLARQSVATLRYDDRG